MSLIEYDSFGCPGVRGLGDRGGGGCSGPHCTAFPVGGGVGGGVGSSGPRLRGCFLSSGAGSGIGSGGAGLGGFGATGGGSMDPGTLFKGSERRVSDVAEVQKDVGVPSSLVQSSCVRMLTTQDMLSMKYSKGAIHGQYRCLHCCEGALLLVRFAVV